MIVFHLTLICLLSISTEGQHLPENRTAEEEELEMRTALENEDLFEGDILLDSLFLNAIPLKWRLWPNGVIPYVIDVSLALQTRLLMEAIQQYNTKTCIRFIPRSNQKDYIKIFKGQGCYSMVGKVGGEQQLSIGRGCAIIGTVVHELGHAVGFFHEHSRSDRDQYIDLHLENVDPKYHSQFQKLQPWQNRLYTKFDYDSIMLYGSTSFSKKRGEPSMLMKNGSTIEEVYRRDGMSQSDIKRVNLLYDCHSRKA